MSVTGSPSLTIIVGTTSVTVDYDAAKSQTAGADKVVFSRTVAEYNDDGITVNSGIALNGGTILDRADNDAATRTAELANQGSHKLDTTGPTVVSVVIASTAPTGAAAG